MKTSDKGRLFILALAVAFVIIAGFAAAILFIPAEYSDRIQGNWVRFGFMSGVFIAYTLRTYWEARKLWRFWGVFLLFLTLHFSVVAHVWNVYHGFSTLVVALVGCAEWLCMALVIHWTLGIRPSFRRRSSTRWIPSI